MSLTRKFLEGMGLEDKQVSAIIDAHAETVDALKEKIESAKDSVKDYEATKAELLKVNKELEELKSSGGDWESKYQKLSSEYETYKSEIADRENKQKVKDAYTELLKETGVSDKRYSAILKVTDISNLKLNDKGSFDNADELKEGIKREWGDFIQTSTTTGVSTPTPPATTQGRYTREEISKMSADEINKNWGAVQASLKNN